MNIVHKRGLVFAADGAAVLGIFFADFLAKLSGILAPSCMLKDISGISCPTCGATHAILSLVHGDLAGALKWNWFAIVLMFYAGIVLVLWNFDCFGSSRFVKKLLSYTLHYKTVIVLGILAGVCCICNNMSLFLSW